MFERKDFGKNARGNRRAEAPYQHTHQEAACCCEHTHVWGIAPPDFLCVPPSVMLNTLNLLMPIGHKQHSLNLCIARAAP